MDRLTAAKVFVDVAYSRSFTATAERLEMSRPMVTRYIEAMEDWLQTRLLHRTTRKISLTTSGESCLKEVETWLEQAEELTSSTAYHEELSGTIRIAASMSFGFSQLMPALKDFMQVNPMVKIDIDLEDSVTNLTEQRIDLAIRIAADPDPSLIGKPIAICESVIVAAPEYLLGKKKITKPQDLVHHECLGYKNFERHIWHLSKKNKFESVDINCRLTANEATVLLHAALCGAGISLQPTYLANKHIQEKKLNQILPNWKPNALKIYALYASRKHIPPAVRALIDYLTEYFKHHPW
ncbi:MAG: LysR family transcriptional regulator [Neptuniibacter sp.]